MMRGEPVPEASAPPPPAALAPVEYGGELSLSEQLRLKAELVFTWWAETAAPALAAYAEREVARSLEEARTAAPPGTPPRPSKPSRVAPTPAEMGALHSELAAEACAMSNRIMDLRRRCTDPALARSAAELVALVALQDLGSDDADGGACEAVDARHERTVDAFVRLTRRAVRLRRIEERLAPWSAPDLPHASECADEGLNALALATELVNGVVDGAIAPLFSFLTVAGTAMPSDEIDPTERAPERSRAGGVAADGEGASAAVDGGEAPPPSPPPPSPPPSPPSLAAAAAGGDAASAEIDEDALVRAIWQTQMAKNVGLVSSRSFATPTKVPPAPAGEEPNWYNLEAGRALVAKWLPIGE